MALTLTIAAVTKTLLERSLHISETANGRATASFSIVSLDASYRPALDAEVIILDGATTIFAGLVERPRERGIVPETGPGIVTSVSAVDYNTYADRRYVNGVIPAGTLKAALQVLVTFFTPYGVTLDAGQVNGPTLPDLTYFYRSTSDVLNELMTLTADAGEPYVWRISNAKVLRAYQPSTTAAPFNLIGNVLPQVIGDITVESSREHYANRVIVLTPTKTEMGRIETFTGDGTTTSFTLQYQLFGHRGYVGTSSNPYETLRTFGDPASWTYDAVTNTINRDAGAPANGETVTINFDGTFSGQGIAEDAGEIASFGPWEKVVTVESIPSTTTAQALADAYLARCLPVTKAVKYRTMQSGLAIGQTQTITVSRRNLTVTAVVTDIVTRDLGKDRLIRDVSAIVDAAQTNLGRGWRDTYKLWAGDKTGSSTAVTAGVTTQGGPGGPNTAVQWNNNGVFGGEAEFTYNLTTNSLVCGGGGSSNTASSPESCQVFGYNCHIDDP